MKASHNEPKPGPIEARRPIASRNSPGVKRLAALMLKTGVAPNQISVASIAAACVGGAALMKAPQHPTLFLVTVICIQLRLMCNLLDGLVAVEGGQKTRDGPLYNEIPDRIADTVLILALGYALEASWPGWAWIGWAGALAAAVTAYIRILGGSLGLAQDFRGPMAKQHRMGVMTVACLAAFTESWMQPTAYALLAGAIIILAGSLLTCGLRTLAIRHDLLRGKAET
jgi:phosphatidylglycerophosphate synthase